jgi:putative Holliday junction resolvase
MRTLAIDLGTRRVGLAMSDESGRFATPIDVLQVNGSDQAIPPILALIQKEGVQRIVVGLPLNMDDTLGPTARSTIAWADELSKRSRTPVIFVDERLSSFAAEQDLIDRQRGGEKITRKQKKGKLDALVAAGLLQGFLDGKLAALQVTPRMQ